MLKNDESKRIASRFKKSKDFYKTIEKLKKEGYKVFYNEYDEHNTIKTIGGDIIVEKIIMVGKGASLLCAIYFEDNDEPTSEYKHNLLRIYY